MWVYDKKLEYPIKIKNRDPRMAKLIVTQYGGPYPGRRRLAPAHHLPQYRTR